jgi:hypothetical protein
MTCAKTTQADKTAINIFLFMSSRVLQLWFPAHDAGNLGGAKQWTSTAGSSEALGCNPCLPVVVQLYKLWEVMVHHLGCKHCKWVVHRELLLILACHCKGGAVQRSLATLTAIAEVPSNVALGAR